MTPPHTDVSVVISAYTEKRWEHILAAVRSAVHQTVAPREVVLCIDHNATLLERAHATFSDTRLVRIIDNTLERGVSGARNSAVHVAQGHVVAFLDDDAEAAPDWLEWLTAGYADPRVLGIGGSIEANWLSGRPGWFPREFEWVVGCSYRGLPDTTAAQRNMIGANMSFRRQPFLELGGFRCDIGRVGEYPPVGCEDTALCIAARQRWPWAVFLYEPRAHVLHAVPRAKAAWAYYVARCYGEGLSKAKLAHEFGTSDSLARERTYLFRTLPSGVALSVYEAIVRWDAVCLARGAAILAGLASTVAGYGLTSLRNRRVASTAGVPEPAS